MNSLSERRPELGHGVIAIVRELKSNNQIVTAVHYVYDPTCARIETASPDRPEEGVVETLANVPYLLVALDGDELAPPPLHTDGVIWDVDVE